jgi:predicted amidohydrolase YtcJ
VRIEFEPGSILVNAHIHTFDQREPLPSALVIQGDRVRFAGDEPEAISMAGPKSEILDLNGRHVLPGLIDSHIHIETLSLSLEKVDCDTPTKSACLDRVNERSRSAPEDEWVLGHGWNQNKWGGFGNRGDLDLAAPDNPVYLTATTLHTAWANSRALQIAGVNRDTPDPPGGRIERDAERQPTGILFESAMHLVADQIPPPSLGTRMRAMRRTQELMWKAGLTGAHDVDGVSCLETLQALNSQGELGLRIRKTLPRDSLDAARALRLRSGFGDALLRICGVKLFSDGALGQRTAAVLDPYLEEPDNRGILLLEREQLINIGTEAREIGLPLFVHAIGDYANRVVLDALQELRAMEPPDGQPRPTHRIEHAQLLHPDDIPRFARLGVSASMQPIHAPSDHHMAERYWGDRCQNAYAWHSLLRSGANLAFGSDAPVDTFSPFIGVFAATTRRSPYEQSRGASWIPEQCIGRKQALQAYTLGAARSVGEDGHWGRLLPGYYADLIILDDDPLQVDEEELPTMKIAGTMVGGEWKWLDF